MKDQVRILMERRADLIKQLVPEIRFEVKREFGLVTVCGFLGKLHSVAHVVGNRTVDSCKCLVTDRLMIEVFGGHGCDVSVIKDLELTP